MKTQFTALWSIVRLLPVALLCSGALYAQEDGELIFNGANSDTSNSAAASAGNLVSVSGGTLALAGSVSATNFSASTLPSGTFVFNGGTLTISAGVFALTGNTTTLSNDIRPVFFGATSLSALSGSVADLSIKPNHDGSLYHVKATVWLRNIASKAFHNVTATVYLSDDNTLSADDMKVVTLNLSDYVPKGKIGKFKALSLPFKHKVPEAFASYLEGKYLIVVLGADDLGTVTVPPVVVGPIKLP